MNFCPVCRYFAIYLDPDEPHLLKCVLKYAVEVKFVGVDRWWRWRNPNV